jgi:hyperosmotically inducible protein
MRLEKPPNIKEREIMNTTWWKRTAVGGVMLAGLTFGAPTFAATPDAWVTTKAKLALLTTSGVSSTDVNVDTVDGHVTLHGKVASEQEKARAEQAVRGVDGVTDVRNMLVVVPASQQKAVEVADDQIKAQVEKTLKADKSLSDSNIEVASVNKGVVVLRGTAASLTDHLNAVADARGVRGVRQVASEIKSPDTLSDAEIWRGTKGKTAETASTVGGTVTDMWITSAAKVRLIANEKTPATQINVDTSRGVVTLFGMAPSDAAKRAAEVEVSKVSGVKQVRNELQVVPSEAQKAVKANDSEIKDMIAKKVDKAVIDDSDIKVDVKDGVVRLSGEVEHQTDRLRALTIARSTDGVRSVVDDLQVKVQ